MADSLKVSVGEWHSKLKKRAGQYGEAGKCIFTLEPAEFVVPAPPTQEAGEHKDVYVARYRDYTELKNRIERRRDDYNEEAGKITALLATCPDEHLESQMRSQEERLELALQSYDLAH